MRSLARSPVDARLDLLWRWLHLAFGLSAGTALLYLVANYRQGRLALAWVDGASLAALVVGYGISRHLGSPKTGIQAIAVIAWLTLAITITMHGGLRSPAVAWIVVLAPLLMLAGLGLGLTLTAATVALIAGLFVAERFDWAPPNPEVAPAQRALSAMLITLLFALAAASALRWRTRMTDQLEAARDEAIEAGRLKDRFIANLNHEIRTPMNALIAGAQLLDGQNMSSEQRALVQAVQHSAEHLLALVNDVLDFDRLEAGEVRLDAVAFSARDLSRTAIAMFRAQAQAKEISLSLDLREGLPDAWIGDPTRLRQVLCNLLSNSIKFTPARGRVLLRVAEAPALEAGPSLCFEVLDSGPGMTADAQARLFQPYSQGDASISQRLGGSGLGLSICKELLLLMKGSIEVESQPGSGATFRVTVPLARVAGDEDRQPPTESISPSRVPPNLKVLLVEDDAVNQVVMEAVLRDLGAQVLTAGSGEQALALLEGGAVDLVLMDCQLPEMDGLAATRHWRDTEGRLRLRRIPVIGLTGDVYSGAREACLDAGMDDYLAKPASRAEVRAALARWAGGARRR